MREISLTKRTSTTTSMFKFVIARFCFHIIPMDNYRNRFLYTTARGFFETCATSPKHTDARVRLKTAPGGARFTTGSELNSDSRGPTRVC